MKTNFDHSRSVFSFFTHKLPLIVMLNSLAILPTKYCTHYDKKKTNTMMSRDWTCRSPKEKRFMTGGETSFFSENRRIFWILWQDLLHFASDTTEWNYQLLFRHCIGICINAFFVTECHVVRRDGMNYFFLQNLLI